MRKCAIILALSGFDSVLQTIVSFNSTIIARHGVGREDGRHTLQLSLPSLVPEFRYIAVEMHDCLAR